MKATISPTITKEVDALPKSCSVCPFVDVCDSFMFGITKNGGYQFTKAAQTRRHKDCTLKVEG